jgi:type III secretion protein L
MDLVVLIDAPGFTLAGSGRLLKQPDAAAVTTASDLLARAQARDTLLLEQTRNACEQSRRSGWDEGMAEAREQMAHRLAAALAARQIALQSLTPALADIVADAVTLLVKGMPRRNLLGAALDSVSGMLKQARWARLRVHPTQADEARTALAEARAELAAVDIVTVVADAAIDVDGCIFETDVGIADASLPVQLTAIRAAVATAVASSAGTPLAGTSSAVDPAAVA